MNSEATPSLNQYEKLALTYPCHPALKICPHPHGRQWYQTDLRYSVLAGWMETVVLWCPLIRYYPKQQQLILQMKPKVNLFIINDKLKKMFSG